jgi:hypothetical protein
MCGFWTKFQLWSLLSERELVAVPIKGRLETGTALGVNTAVGHAIRTQNKIHDLNMSLL